MTQFVIALADTLNASAIAEVIAAPFKAVARLSRSFIERLEKDRLVNLTIKELSRLSDSELADIGISRGMIRSVAMEAYK
jgi:uncharacterized protein YjiS (DUF1127 family)